jgi:hypothetical protein
MIEILIDTSAATDAEVAELEAMPAFGQWIGEIERAGQGSGLVLRVVEAASETVRQMLLQFPPELRTPETLESLQPPRAATVRVVDVDLSGDGVTP